VCEWLFPADVIDSGNYDLSDAISLFSKVNEQDFAAAEWCQPNMSSRAYRHGGVLVPSEQTQIGLYYRWYHRALGSGA
jgi:Rieske 2Fe-2S family protein